VISKHHHNRRLALHASGFRAPVEEAVTDR
jgi:hypothetical protein